MRLPVLSHRVPDTDLSGRRESDELSSDEEERIDGDVEIEGADVDSVSGLGEKHRPDFVAERNGDHRRGRLAARGHADGPHLRVDGHPLDRRVEVRTGKDCKRSCYGFDI